jgi:hypothetical protein
MTLRLGGAKTLGPEAIDGCFWGVVGPAPVSAMGSEAAAARGPTARSGCGRVERARQHAGRPQSHSFTHQGVGFIMPTRRSLAE